MKKNTLTILVAFLLVGSTSCASETVALWLFDEPVGLYPSSSLDSSTGLDAPLVLGLGGTVVPGKFGHALSTVPHRPVEIPTTGESTAALGEFPTPAGRTQEPLTWRNNHFAALMTSGEKHLRKEVSFVSPTHTDLNLGAFDWTVEFWLKSNGTDGSGTVFEIGTGPRGENQIVTRLSCDPQTGGFEFEGRMNGTPVKASSDEKAKTLASGWHHFALVYTVENQSLNYYIDGHLRAGVKGFALQKLPEGDEDYMSVGRDGEWGRPLPGTIDELRISRGAVYTKEFTPPDSFAPVYPQVVLKKGLPLLFAPGAPEAKVIPLGSRKYVFIDDALIEKSEHVSFSAHQPTRIDRVIDGTHGEFRKHLTVIEDGDGLIRIYNPGPDDWVMVHTSRDGVHFEAPDTGIHHKGSHNIVIPEPAPMGRPIIDPNGPSEDRWKYISGLEGRGDYLYTSPDGWKWKRQRAAVMPFRSGSQESLFYDDQRELYVGYKRTGFPMSAGGGTQREFVLAETKDIYAPWPVKFQTAEEIKEIAKTRSLRTPQPWWLDNGPLTPGDFGVELPTVFAPDDAIDPPGSGVYVPKADKYAWAPDTYYAFPVMYFDYEEPLQPETRRILYEDKSRNLGSGLVETQLAASRDGVHWKRFPSPTYLQVGTYEGRSLHQIYMAEGMVRRGDEIWQYFYGQEDFHSPVKRDSAGNGVYRAVQRLDGFISADSPYDRLAKIVTKPFIFTGNRLEMNINTGGLGYAQVGFEDESGQPIPGFGIDDCVFINGNFVTHPIEWLGRGTDVSSLAGRTVRLVIRMRGTSLYALQFVSE